MKLVRENINESIPLVKTSIYNIPGLYNFITNEIYGKVINKYTDFKILQLEKYIKIKDYYLLLIDVNYNNRNEYVTFLYPYNNYIHSTSYFNDIDDAYKDFYKKLSKLQKYYKKHINESIPFSKNINPFKLTIIRNGVRKGSTYNKNL